MSDALNRQIAFSGAFVAQALVPAAPRLVSAQGPAIWLRIPGSISHSPGMDAARRRLPHRYPAGKWLFLSWHLHGSSPHALYPPANKLTAGRASVWMDRYLHTTRAGPMYLRQEKIAQVVVTALQRGVQLGHYLLPKVPPSRLLQSLKGVTAREANKSVGRTGEPFWQAESYDHWVGDEEEAKKIVAYIENNPLKAGLVARAEDYVCSSASVRPPSAETSLGAADTSACATKTTRTEECRGGGS